jgi:putative transposase
MDTADHAAFDITYHLVLVTKYRRRALTATMLEECREIFANVLEHWRCQLIELNGEPDHLHILLRAHPALDLSRLVNNLKTASSRRLRNRHRAHLNRFYSKPVLWHRAYFVASVGNVSLETVRRYVQNQAGAA